MSGKLQRLIITFKPEELVMHVLYRSEAETNLGTVRRRRQVEDLTREGLRQALTSLEGRVDVVGTSGYEVREDIVLCTARGGTAPDERKTVKKGA